MGITGYEMVATEVWAHKHINHSNKIQRDATHRLEKSWFTLNLIDGIFAEPRTTAFIFYDGIFQRWRPKF